MKEKIITKTEQGTSDLLDGYMEEVWTDILNVSEDIMTVRARERDEMKRSYKIEALKTRRNMLFEVYNDMTRRKMELYGME